LRSHFTWGSARSQNMSGRNISRMEWRSALWQSTWEKAETTQTNLLSKSLSPDTASQILAKMLPEKPSDMLDYGEATLAQNKIFNPIIPRTTAVIGHRFTTRRAEQRKTSRCRRTRRAVPCSRRRPSRPRTVRPSAPDAAPPRYPHVQGGNAAYRTARFATAAWRGREASGYSFAGGKLG
jgi:hypothetical protein